MKKVLLSIILYATVPIWSQMTAIPDPNFEQALIDLGHDDVLDGQVLTNRIDTITNLSVHSKSISDLAGIEDFISLQTLTCSYNYLSELDISNISSLTRLWCRRNEISNLTLGNLEFLEWIFCDFNLLTELNVGGLPELKYLRISHNPILFLNLSTNHNLHTLWCGGCQQLQCLNIANGNDGLGIINALDNPNLSCIEVDDVAVAVENWTDSIDPQIIFSEDCDNPCSTSNASLGGLHIIPKTVVKMFDLMGRETTFKPNTALIYVYDDGSTEKVFSVE